MKYVIRIACSVVVVNILAYFAPVFAETVAATCYEPNGKRLEYVDGRKEESNDGYSNSNPTFFYSSKDPKVLIESWQAALPFPELLDRERVDEIVPPTVTRSVVVISSDHVIHAISVEKGTTYTTTLYLDEGVGIFTRVRLATGGILSAPMGAVYTAKCNFQIV